MAGNFDLFSAIVDQSELNHGCCRFLTGPQAGDLTVHTIGECKARDFDLVLVQIGQIFAAACPWALSLEDFFKQRREFMLSPGQRNLLEALTFDGRTEKLPAIVTFNLPQAGFYRVSNWRKVIDHDRLIF